MNLILWLTLMLVQSASSGQDTLPDYAPKLANYGEDFALFAKAHQGSLEFEISTDLSHEAVRDTDAFVNAGVFLHVYQTVDEASRAKIKSAITNRVDAAIEIIRSSITNVTRQTAFTKLPAVAQEAGHMRDDLRKISDLLEAERKKIAN